MKRVLSTVVAFAVLVESCTGQELPEVQIDEMRYVVFRYQLENLRPNLKEKVAVYYFATAERDVRDRYPGPLPLGDKRHDPSEALLARFKDHNPPIRRNSELRTRSPDDPKRSLRLRVTRIQWIAADEAEVVGGHDDAWSATWIKFSVKIVDGNWKVIKADLQRSFIN